MIRSIFIAFLAIGIFAGCATPYAKDRVFSDDWESHNRRNPSRDRRTPAAPEQKKEERLGPATVTRDEQGRPRLGIGGRTGLGVDVNYRGGPSGRVRYRHEWDFVRPQRNR